MKQATLFNTDSKQKKQVKKQGKIYYNKLNVDLNYEKINTDFFIVGVQGNQVKYDHEVLDKICQEGKALSVVFVGYGLFYVLFKKTDFKNQRQIRKYLQGFDIAGTVLKNLKTEISKRHLSQLFFNYIPHCVSTDSFSTDSVLSKNNITGKLIYVISTSKIHKRSFEGKNGDKHPIQYVAIEIKLEEDLILAFPLKTFTHVSEEKYIKWSKKRPSYMHPKYIIDEGYIKRLFGSNKSEKHREKSYYNRQIQINSNRKNHVSFFDTVNFDKFELSKTGLLITFIKDVSYYLKDYLSISFEKFNVKKSLVYDGENIKSNTRLIDFKKKIEVNIVDKTSNPTIQKQLENAIKTTGVKHVYSTQRIAKNSSNVIIIQDLKDENYTTSSTTPIQCITLGNVEKYLKTENGDAVTIGDVILKELQLKADIIAKQISIVDWKKFGLKGGWKFITTHKECICGVVIDSKGKLHFENSRLDFKTSPYTANNLFDEEIRYWIDIFYNYNGTKYTRSHIEGVIISPNGDINTIADAFITLPNLKLINRWIKNLNQDLIVSKSKLNEILTLFLKEYGVKWGKTSAVQIKELRKILKSNIEIDKELLWSRVFPTKSKNFAYESKTDFAKKFNWFYFEQTKHQDLLLFTFKSAPFGKEIFKGNIEVKRLESGNSYQGYYFVGHKITKGKSINRTLPNSTHIREVKAVEGNLILDNVLQLMNVDFVKMNELTVLPFPFKYIREYVNGL